MHIIDMIMHDELDVHLDFDFVVKNMAFLEWITIMGIVAYEQYSACVNSKHFVDTVKANIKEICNQDPVLETQEEWKELLHWMTRRKFLQLTQQERAAAGARMVGGGLPQDLSFLECLPLPAIPPTITPIRSLCGSKWTVVNFMVPHLFNTHPLVKWEHNEVDVPMCSLKDLLNPSNMLLAGHTIVLQGERKATSTGLLIPDVTAQWQSWSAGVNLDNPYFCGNPTFVAISLLLSMDPLAPKSPHLDCLHALRHTKRHSTTRRHQQA